MARVLAGESRMKLIAPCKRRRTSATRGTEPLVRNLLALSSSGGWLGAGGRHHRSPRIRRTDVLLRQVVHTAGVAIDPSRWSEVLASCLPLEGVLHAVRQRSVRCRETPGWFGRCWGRTRRSPPWCGKPCRIRVWTPARCRRTTRRSAASGATARSPPAPPPSFGCR